MLQIAFVCTPFCMLLQVFGSCCAKFETGQTLSYMKMQTDATTPNIVGQQCWESLRPFTCSLIGQTFCSHMRMVISRNPILKVDGHHISDRFLCHFLAQCKQVFIITEHRFSCRLEKLSGWVMKTKLQSFSAIFCLWNHIFNLSDFSVEFCHKLILIFFMGNTEMVNPTYRHIRKRIQR